MIDQLIEKYNGTLDTVRAVIFTSESNEDILTAQAVERFIIGFINDLKVLKELS